MPVGPFRINDAVFQKAFHKHVRRSSSCKDHYTLCEAMRSEAIRMAMRGSLHASTV